MQLKHLREQVLDANLELVRRGLVLYTFGNVSGISREDGFVLIKPSGVPYETMTVNDLVLTDLQGNIVDSKLRPSSDLPTHLALYKAFGEIGGIAHTHSRHATAWAQARKPIPCFGTTHADYFHGPVPVTEILSRDDVLGDYEINTGSAIIRASKHAGYLKIPGMLVANHGPFTWGSNAVEAAHNAVILEEIAHTSYLTVQINGESKAIARELHDRHYLRKHGSKAYYGQPR